ncbi:hypothetical protein UA45_02600 [Morganella morganii]|uniref:Auxin efflux carrier n=1 Tax=Morganella morganii TaxID=582 RepID=A0A0D8LCV5_MORMO|nr:hypothetical protein UA45_02600 [Morganella morganii]
MCYAITGDCGSDCDGVNPTGISAVCDLFAIPTAPTAYILSRQLGGDSQLMAGIITFQTMVAVLTLPVVLTMIT